MSPPVRRPSVRLALGALAVFLPFGLACSGLPVPGEILGSGEGVDEDGADEGTEPEEGEGDGEPVAAEPEPEPKPADAESMFADLDPDEAPPYAKGQVKCPAPTMQIRHPKAGVMTVYCATGSGVRTGPYTEWQKNALVVAATNVDGKFDGAWTRWAKGTGDAPRKVEHQVYAAGVATGDHAEWDAEGHLLVRGKLVDGKKDGRFIERKWENDAVVPGGACYQAGTEVWRTSDEAELVSKACGTDTVAEN